MAIDPSVFNALSAPRKTAFDYANDAMGAQTNALQLQAARQSMADDQEIRRFYREGGAVDTPEGMQKLMAISPKAGAAAAQQQAALMKDRNAAEKTAAETAKLKYDQEQARRQQQASFIASLPTPEAARESLQQSVGSGDIDMRQATALIKMLETHPQGFDGWKQSLVRSVMAPKDVTDAQDKDRNFKLRVNNELIGPDGKVNQALVVARSQVASAGAANVSYGAPMAGVDAAGNPVFFQPTKTGGAPAIVQGVSPVPKEEKPLPGPVVKQLTEARDNAATLSRLSESFKPEFASKGVLGLGAEAQLTASGVLGADADSVEWWKNYRKQAELIERHALFGAALTPTEQGSWRGADIGPGMDAKIIKRNLETRAKLARKVLEATEADAVDAGYSPKRVAPIARRGEGTGTGSQPVRVNTDADYNALPPGTRFVTPDGKTGTKR